MCSKIFGINLIHKKKYSSNFSLIVQLHINRQMKSYYHLFNIMSGVLPDDLEEFKFPSKVDSIEDEIFPENGVGNTLFNRRALVNRFLEDVFHSKKRRFYIRGPRGSGKTVLLYLIGRELQRLGETVYVVKHAGALRDLNKRHFMALEDKLREGKKLYLLIDEVHQNTSDKMWNYLLKETSKTITIGFGIPKIQDYYLSIEQKYEPSFVMLTKEDFSTEEELQLLGHGANVSDTSMISDLVDWMLEYTGGHAYPCLKLCEYMLRHQKLCCKERNYESVLNSGEFYESSVFETIDGRAYDLSVTTRESAYNIFKTGVVSLSDVHRISKVGLWNGTTYWFLSNLLVSYLFQKVRKNVSASDYTDWEKPDVFEKVLLYGLSELKKDDFEDSFNGKERYENAIGFIFAMKLCRLPHLFISPQTQVTANSKTTPESKPSIDFFLNGRLKKYLELTRNGVDLAKHFDKFENPDGKYYVHREKYAILDFDLSTNSSIVKVPEKYQNEGLDKRLYSFVKRENALYVGNQRVHSNVSKFLKSSPALDMGKRMFTTLSRLFRLKKLCK